MKTGAAPAAAGCTNQNVSVYFRAANDPSVFTITEKAPTRAFSWLTAPPSRSRGRAAAPKCLHPEIFQHISCISWQSLTYFVANYRSSFKV